MPERQQQRVKAPIVAEFKRGPESGPVWSFSGGMGPDGPVLVATFNARAALKDWQPR